MAKRRLRREPASLEVTAFINLVVVLVPFLLSIAVFSRLAVVNLALPAQNAANIAEKLQGNDLKLEVVIRPAALEVGDRIGGLIQRIETRADAAELKELEALMVQLKARFPDKAEATVLAEPDTPYDRLVQVMDAMRATRTARGTQVVTAELFPQLAIGDAPVVKR